MDQFFLNILQPKHVNYRINYVSKSKHRDCIDTPELDVWLYRILYLESPSIVGMMENIYHIATGVRCEWIYTILC